MQDSFCLSVQSKFGFGAAERGVQLLTSLEMKSAEEGNVHVTF